MEFHPTLDRTKTESTIRLKRQPHDNNRTEETSQYADQTEGLTKEDKLMLIKFIFLYVVRICGIRNNVEHLCNSNLLLYYMYICTSRNLLQCCTSNSNVVQS